MENRAGKGTALRWAVLGAALLCLALSACAPKEAAQSETEPQPVSVSAPAAEEEAAPPTLGQRRDETAAAAEAGRENAEETEAAAPPAAEEPPEETDPPAESGHPVPFGIFICNSGLFCEDYRNGSVHDVTFRGIRILSDPGIAVPGPVFRGLDDAHDIRDIRIENLTVNGKKAETPGEAHVKANEFVRNLRIG